MPYATGDILEVRVVTQCDSQIGVNLLHYEVTDTLGLGASFQVLADAINLHFQSAFLALMSSLATWRGIGVRRLIPLPISVETISTLGSTTPGAIGGDILPKQTCGLISKFAVIGGRHGHGRTYVPFPGEASSSPSGVPAAVYVAPLVSLGNQISATILTGPPPAADKTEITPGILDRVGSTISFLSGTTARTGWATQRRRGSYGQGNVPPF